MTAEVMILNKLAVAMAADSAATIGEGDSGKIYNTVNKVFTLSKYRPVGVMVFGNADYMGIPLETAIKMYREEMGPKRSRRLRDYSRDFMRYLGSAPFSSKQQQADNVRGIWHSVLGDVSQEIVSNIRGEYRKKGKCPPRRRDEIFAEVSRVHLQRLQVSKIASALRKRTPSSIVSKYKTEYEAAKAATAISPPDRTTERIWKQIAGLAITRINSFYQTYSGIVVAGFGERDVFPQYVEIHSHGVVSGIHKFGARLNGVSHDNTSIIIPLAQSEMVHRFMDGVDGTYESYLDGAMRDALAETTRGIIDVYVKGKRAEKDMIKLNVARVILSQVKVFQENARKWRRARFVNPVLDAVEVLPKDELANLAEALVNLTSIKRRVSTERETVGGAIDVAVISKGDGFIWIKRKHYFRQELNPFFAANYFQARVTEARRGNT